MVKLPRTPPAPVAHCTADESGNFACDGIVPGRYDVQLAPVWESAAVRIMLSADSKPDPIVLHAAPLATILVHIGHSRSGTSGLFEVLARTGDKPPVVAAAGADGQMRLDLPLGDYLVYLGPSSRAPVEGRRVSLVAHRQVVNVELDAPSLGRIAGVVLDGQGVPVPDLWIHAESAASDGAGVPLGVPALTNAEGEFAIDQLLAGEYHVVTSDLTRLTVTAVPAGALDLVLRDRE